MKVWKWRNFILEWSIAFKRNESLPWEGFDMVRKPGWDISVSWEEKDSDPDVSCHATWTRKLNTHTRPLLSQFKYWIINNPGHTFKKKSLTGQGTFCSFRIVSSIFFPLVWVDEQQLEGLIYWGKTCMRNYNRFNSCCFFLKPEEQSIYLH